MNAALAVFVLAMGTFDVPTTYAEEAYYAAVEHGVDPVDLGSYLVSEHRGAYPTNKCAACTNCSHPGACGVYQITAKPWLDYCGYDRDVRFDPIESAHLAACVLAYSQDSHQDCEGDGHKWQSHLKCRPGGRDGCNGPTRRWVSIRNKLARHIQGK